MQRSSFYLIILSLIALFYVALITFQPSLPFMPNRIVWFVDKQRLLELALLGIILIEACSSVIFNKKQIQINKPLPLGILILLIFAGFSASLAYVPRHAIIEICVFVALGYFSFFVARLYQEDRNKCIKYLAYVIWASILLYMVSFYTGYITATIVKKPLQWPFPFTGFTNIRTFNQYQFWTLGFILLPLLSFELSKAKRLFLHIALTAWWVLLFYSASRGVLIAWLIAMCLTGLAYQKLAWPFLRLQLTHIITGFVSYQVLFKFIPSVNQSILVTHTIARQSTHDRMALWEQAILLIKNSPIFGVGPMHYAWFNKTNGHPHNSILQLASEWGLPATCIILGIAAYAFYCWIKQFNRQQLHTTPTLDKHLSIILFFTMIANASYSMVDGVIVTPISQVLMFTMIGLMLGQYITVSNKSIISGKVTLRQWIAGFVLITMAWATFPEIKQGFSGDKKGFSLGHTAIGPRFWREAPK